MMMSNHDVLVLALVMACRNNTGVTPEQMIQTAAAKLSGKPRVRLSRTVRSEFPGGPVAVPGDYDANINPQGAVRIIFPDGGRLGVKPGEFEWIIPSDPEQTVAEIPLGPGRIEQIRELIDPCEPVHQFFGLSYSSYLVIPRTLLEQMPVKWQQAFVFLLDQANDYFDGIPDVRYSVHARHESTGKFIMDPLANYRHPVKLETKEVATATENPTIPVRIRQNHLIISPNGAMNGDA